MKNWYVILLLCITTTAYSIEENKEVNILQIEKPPLNGYRIAGEILAGVAGGIVGFCGGRLLGIGYMRWAMGIEDEPDLQFIVGFATGITILPLGTAIGVYLVGNIGNETGSFLATLLGSYAGTTLFPITPPVGATLGFNIYRRYKKPPAASGNSLINFRDSKMSLAVPTIHLNPNPYEARTLVLNVDLVKVRF